MTRIFRGPVAILPEPHSTTSLSQSDSMYWSGMDIDSDISESTQISLSPTVRHQSDRHYIDPWDLENYDYLRRNMEPLSDISLTTPSPAGEPISSTFYYISGGADESNRNTCCYAGFDEKSFYNKKFNGDRLYEGDPAYSTYTDIETSSGDRNSSCGSTVSTLHLHTPGFGVASGHRRLVLPKPPPSIEFPGPPSYDYYDLQSENNYCSLNDCYECVNHIPVYDTLKRKQSKSHLTSPNPNFGLSKKGLLQIDYSCNWNNLDRYITK